MTLVRLEQQRKESAHAEIDAAPADVEGSLPGLARRIDDAATAADPGIVEQEMDLVGLLLLDQLVAKPLEVVLDRDVGDVGGDAQALRQLSLSQSRLVSAIASGETSHMATLQPSATSWRASSRPIPVPPPVMTANFPAKSFM